jgi:hypothetical protein
VSTGALIATIILRRHLSASSGDESRTTPVGSRSRRAFLAGATRLGLAVTLGGLLAHVPMPRRAEAACFGCESCEPEIAIAGCSGDCCAFFWVRDREYCEPFCQSCSAWRLEQFCGVPDCCS